MLLTTVGILVGFGFPYKLCCCKDHGSVETVYAVAQLHILRLEGACSFFGHFWKCLPINLPDVTPMFFYGGRLLQRLVSETQ